MLRKLKLLWRQFNYVEGRPGNAALAAQTVYEFNGNSIDQQMRVWAATATGRRYLAGERILDNIESFRDRDPNTLGAKYLEFIDKYNFGEVNSDISIIHGRYKNEIEKAYGTFMADTHDFTHVITGYPPDTLGELMRIRVYKQYEGKGWNVLDRLGWLKTRFYPTQERTWYDKCAQEANETARFAKNYILEDWFKLLGTHIKKVRQNLNTNSTIYWNWEKL